MGEHDIVWDGKDDSGNTLNDGLYGFLVTAIDAEDNPVPLVQGTAGKVTGVKLVDGEVILEIGDLELQINEIRSIKQTAAAAES